MSREKSLNVEEAVLNRYKKASDKKEQSICFSTEYNKDYLDKLPPEIIEKDYGCGDPSKYVKEGETVLDLGSGSGKICYILSQKVGKNGQVIGVDFNDDMLTLSRKYIDEMGNKIGYKNVRFLKGKIQNLALDLDKVQQWLDKNPIKSVEDISVFDQYCVGLMENEPLIIDSSVDVIVSSCVLNLVRPSDKHDLFHEIFRVLKPGGRAVISDIVCDEEPTLEMKHDPELWSSCISGALQEYEFIEMLEESGFYGIEILERTQLPWQVIDGIEFRSITIRAFKPNQQEHMDCNQAVIYRGPWQYVSDDNGVILTRGQRIAVSDISYNILTDPEGPYSEEIIGIPPYIPISREKAEAFDRNSEEIRHPCETKGVDYGANCNNHQCSCC
jgi:ubiquinone/menaquinone biosynthesis C-methylase UbiE